MTQRSSAAETMSRGEIAALLSLLLLALVVRLPFRDAALVRDEGEYAYLAQQILHGAVPYLDVYNQKTPFAFYFVAAVQWLAGESLAALRVATALYGLVTTALVYGVGRRLGGPRTALPAALAFALMSFDQNGVVHSTSTESLMLLWMALALWAWLSPVRTPTRWLLAGAAAGMAVQTKQTGLVVALWLPADALWRWLLDGRGQGGRLAAALRPVAWAAAGFAAVGALFALVFAAQGALDAYLAAAWSHNWHYVARRFDGVAGLVSLLAGALVGVAGVDLGLWSLGAAGLWLLARRPLAPGRGVWGLGVGCLASALLAGRLFVHYFEPLVLPLALGCGAASAWLARRARDRSAGRGARALAGLLLLLPWLPPLSNLAGLLALPGPERASLVRGEPPFDASPAIAAYLAARTEPDECIQIFGSEPQIHFYADRRACTRVVILYPATGPYPFAAELRREFLADLRRERPRYVVELRDWPSWTEFPGPDAQGFAEQTRELLRRGYGVEAVLPAPDPERPEAPSGYAVIHRRRG